MIYTIAYTCPRCQRPQLIVGRAEVVDGSTRTVFGRPRPDGRRGERLSACVHCRAPLPDLSWEEFLAILPTAWGA